MAERGRIGAEVSKQVRRKGKGLRPGELGPLRSPQDAERWLRIVGRAVAEGRLRNRDADATTRAVKEWLRAHAAAVAAAKAGAAAAETAVTGRIGCQKQIVEAVRVWTRICALPLPLCQ